MDSIAFLSRGLFYSHNGKENYELLIIKKNEAKLWRKWDNQGTKQSFHEIGQ